MNLSTLPRWLFSPLPVRPEYLDTQILALLILCVGLIVAAVILRFWRKNLPGASFKKLSRSWPTAATWFGIIGLILIVARVEGIQYVAMRFWWVVWGLAALAYIFVQLRLFRAKHYEIIPTAQAEDPRDAYLPKAKRK